MDRDFPEGSPMSRRRVLGMLGAAGTGSIAGCGSSVPFVGDEEESAGGGTSGGVVYPVASDVDGDCEGEDGEEYPTTGSSAANWFHLGDCGTWREYRVTPGQPYRIVAYADDCSLDEAAFAIEEQRGDDWETAREVGPTDITSSTTDRINDDLFGESGDIGIRLRDEPTYEVLYVPDGGRIRLSSLGDAENPGGYLTVFEYPLLSRSSSKSIGPEVYKTPDVPAASRPRNREDNVDPDSDLFVDVEGNEYRFEYEGASTQSVVLHKRDETENHPWVRYWFEFSSGFVSARTDSPPENVEEWDDGEAAYQLLPPDEETIANAEERLDRDLDHLRDVDPPMTIPAEVVTTAGYEARATGGVSVAGTAERLTFNEHGLGLDYAGMVEGDPGTASRNVVADLVDTWEPTPDVPTSAGDLALEALKEEEFMGRAGARLIGQTAGEFGRTIAKPVSWTVNFWDTIDILSPDCSGDWAPRDESGRDRKLTVVTCDRGVVSQNAIVQVAHQKGDSGTVEFESQYELGHPDLKRPDDTSADPDDLAFDGTVTLTHTIEIPPETPLERETRACMAVPDYEAPSAELSLDPEPPYEAGRSVTMTGSATVDPELSVEGYAWIIDPPAPAGVESEPETVRQEGQTLEYTFETVGVYEVELQVTDSEGQVGAASVEVTVERGEAPRGYVRLTGTILRADGEGAAPGFVEFLPVSEAARGGEQLLFEVGGDGTYTADVPADEGYRVEYTQAPRYPEDGAPDLYAIGTVYADESRTLPPLSLPEPYPVSVAVVDGDGEPVTEGRCTVGHFVRTPGTDGDGTYDGPAAGYDDDPETESQVSRHGPGPGARRIDLDENGRAVFDTADGETEELELAGSIEVSYRSPDDEWWGGVTTRVTGPATVTITVDGDPGWETR